MDKNEFYLRTMPLLQAAAFEVQQQVEGVRLVVDLDVREGCSLGAFFTTTRADTDLLQLLISFHVVTGRELMSAQVIWGHDSLFLEAEHPEDGYLQVAPDQLVALFAELPRLIDAFKAAVLRGCPRDSI